ncbi:MAG: single-stranded-DNA-specific exonuclease RecJ, partial [Pseudomonadota bacterium]
FGVGNPEPVFALANVRVWQVDILKDKHIRLQMSDWEGVGRMKGMLFGGVGTELGEAILTRKHQPFHFAGQFSINSWQGRESVEFHISDGALVID